MTSREKFEAWMTAEQWFHGSDFEWDERRNCYAQFGIHLAYKAFLAAEGAAEQRLTDLAVQLANAESKCTTLAAENAGLKKFGETLFEMHEGLNGSGTGIQGEHEAVCQQVALDAAMDAFDEIKTPATDAFLAEVRASELDSLAGVAETMLVKFSNQLCSSDMHEVVGWKMVLQQANNRADQLRKGGAA